MPSRPPALPLQAYAHGIYAVDAEYDAAPGLAAIHLIAEQGRIALVDTGTKHSLPAVLDALALIGARADAVDAILLTHVHLDHAGGAGAMMQAFPNATAYVHPSGIRHLQDPSFLEKAVRAVYGDAQFDKVYGQIVPIDAARLQAVDEGDRVMLGQRPIDVLYTPGHARHHVAFFDPTSRGLFTGDTFGLSYPACDVAGQPFLLPSSSPSQFDPAQLRDSITRMLALKPEHVYLTHYGERGRDAAHVQAMGQSLLRHIDAFVAMAQDVASTVGLAPERQAKRHQALKDAMQAHVIRSLRAHGSTLDDAAITRIWGLDIELNAQGLGVWLNATAHA